LRPTLAQGLYFNGLKRVPIAPASTRHIPQLSMYHGWSTQQLFESAYEKLATLKHAATLRQSRQPIRIGVRLTNVFKPVAVLAHHIGR
jgi:hypothetical protein